MPGSCSRTDAFSPVFRAKRLLKHRKDYYRPKFRFASPRSQLVYFVDDRERPLQLLSYDLTFAQHTPYRSFRGTLVRQLVINSQVFLYDLLQIGDSRLDFLYGLMFCHRVLLKQTFDGQAVPGQPARYTEGNGLLRNLIYENKTPNATSLRISQRKLEQALKY